MNPNYNHTVTLYNCLKGADNPTKKDIWLRTVMPQCFYKAVMSRTENGKELSMSNTYTVRIPQSNKYIPYHKWILLPDDERIYYFTIRVDDIVIHGECSEEITGETGSTASDLMRKYKPDAFKVTAFTDNTSFPSDRHYRLGG